MKRFLIFISALLFSFFSPWWIGLSVIFILATIFGFSELIFLGLILDFSFGYGGYISNILFSLSILIAVIMHKILKPFLRFGL